MIGYLLKNWKLLLDLILVVGGIIALAIFDPFGMFSKAKLKDTANLVSSIKEIGELTTAEYYGEVVSSLHETVIYNVPADSLHDEFENCYLEIRRAVVDTLNKRRRIRNRHWRDVEASRRISDVKTDYDTDPKTRIYRSLIVFIAANNLSGEAKDYYKIKDKDIKLTNNVEKKVFQFLTNQFASYRNSLKKDREDITDVELDKYIFDLPKNFSLIAKFYYNLKKDSETDKKKDRKRDIVFIGRGWVKAGFRFGQLDESNFYYNKEQKTIHFYGLVPTILDKDINPWFIPEEKIKGFDLVSFYNKATFEEAKDVKIKCKQKLLEQAKKADILKVALENGEEALQNFFGLLLDEPDLRVQLHKFPFAKEYEMIAADTLVTVQEALRIKQLFETSNFGVNLSSAELAEKRNEFQLFLNRLKKLSFVDKQFKFSLLSMKAAEILDHKLFVSTVDYDSLKEFRQQLIENKEGNIETAYMQSLLFYDQYYDFTADFNQMLLVIDSTLDKAAHLRKDTLYLSKDQRKNLSIELDSNQFEIIESNNKKDTIYKILHKEVTLPTFYNLLYPNLQLNASLFEKLKLKDTTKVHLLVKNEISNATPENFGDKEIEKLFLKDIKLIGEYKTDSIKDDIVRRPIRKFSKKIKKYVPS